MQIANNASSVPHVVQLCVSVFSPAHFLIFRISLLPLIALSLPLPLFLRGGAVSPSSKQSPCGAPWRHPFYSWIVADRHLAVLDLPLGKRNCARVRL